MGLGEQQQKHGNGMRWISSDIAFLFNSVNQLNESLKLPQTSIPSICLFFCHHLAFCMKQNVRAGPLSSKQRGLRTGNVYASYLDLMKNSPSMWRGHRYKILKQEFWLRFKEKKSTGGRWPISKKSLIIRIPWGYTFQPQTGILRPFQNPLTAQARLNSFVQLRSIRQNYIFTVGRNSSFPAERICFGIARRESRPESPFITI